MQRQSLTSLLLATDRLASPLLEAGAAEPTARAAYTPYGYRPGGPQGMHSRTGFTGQLREPETGWYMLGNGHRAYNPILMRFHSPDRLSPFGDGDINSYAYCGCDPVNMLDPTGRVPYYLSPITGLLSNILSGVSSYFSLRNLTRTHRAERPARRASDANLADAAATTTRRRDIGVSSLSAVTAAIGGGTTIMRMVDPNLGEAASYLSLGATAITLATTGYEIYQQNQRRPWELGPDLRQLERVQSPQVASYLQSASASPQLSRFEAPSMLAVESTSSSIRSGQIEVSTL
ncbi:MULTISPECIES: RHS repeat-associated core domain-containing protein [unclassified Pseudomonas]|uniref:RHS repeat-associated core domain-containing protein n=1 Tax=unclassified Pseudomonas TaxID=196821 RepID=UPI0037F5BD65